MIPKTLEEGHQGLLKKYALSEVEGCTSYLPGPLLVSRPICMFGPPSKGGPFVMHHAMQGISFDGLRTGWFILNRPKSYWPFTILIKQDEQCPNEECPTVRVRPATLSVEAGTPIPLGERVCEGKQSIFRTRGFF